jgi:hypothetical protein
MIQEGDIPFAGHEHSDGTAFSPRVPKPPCDSSATNKLSSPSDNDEKDDVSPNLPSVEQAHVGIETRKHEILVISRGGGRRLTMGRNKKVTRSSIFSTSEIAKPP